MWYYVLYDRFNTISRRTKTPWSEMFCCVRYSGEVTGVTVVGRARVGNTNTTQTGHVIDNSINKGPVTS